MACADVLTVEVGEGIGGCLACTLAVALILTVARDVMRWEVWVAARSPSKVGGEQAIWEVRMVMRSGRVHTA